MAEILLEGRDCETCGTEVRKGALFCYYCGMSVAPDLAVAADTKKDKVNDARLNESVSESIEENEELKNEPDTIEDKSEIAKKDSEDARIVEDDAEIDKSESVTIEDKAETAEKEIIAEKTEKSKPKTAAAMRRKPKDIKKKRVEIVWEKPNSPPNIWFLVATILFAALAVGLWIVANYLG